MIYNFYNNEILDPRSTNYNISKSLMDVETCWSSFTRKYLCQNKIVSVY